MNLKYVIKKFCPALASVAQLAEPCPTKRRGVDRSPGQGTRLGCRPGPLTGCV